MAAPSRSGILSRRSGASRPVGCACPKCLTPLRPERAGVFACPRCTVELELWITAAAVRDLQPVPASVAVAGEDHPSCVNHSHNASIASCGRCGDFICEVCRIQIEGRELCPNCFERGIDRAELDTVQRQFRTPDFALGIGALAIPGGCLVSYFAAFVGLLAVGLGIQALVKIQRQPALKGKGKAVAGIVFGSMAFLLWVGVFVFILTGAFGSMRHM